MFLLFACAPGSSPLAPASGEPAPEHPAHPAPDPTSPNPGTTSTDADCGQPLEAGISEVVDPIRTSADFDFDADGHLVSEDLDNLVGYPRGAGAPVVLAEGIGADAAGIRALVTGDFVVARPTLGVVELIDGVTGEATTLYSGLAGPTALEVGLDGLVYVAEYAAEGGVRIVDPYGDTEGVIATPWAAAIALSPDDQTLYVSMFEVHSTGTDGIRAVDRGPNGEWSAPRLVLRADDPVMGLQTDVCGNVYGIRAGGGRLAPGELFRIASEDATVDLVATFASTSELGFFGNARFGAGFGGWERSEIYVSDGSRVHAVDVGVEGRHVLAP